MTNNWNIVPNPGDANMTDLPQPSLPPATHVPELRSAEKRRRVALVIGPYPLASEYIGPADVFQAANLVLAISGKSDMGYDLEFVSSHPGTLCELRGLKIVSDRSYSELKGRVDTLIFTPIDFELLLAAQDKFLRWVARKAGSVRRVVSVCAGAYVLAAAGVLDGKRATTHWDLVDDFSARYPDIDVDPEPIYTRDGHIYTSAGLTAGVDLALALVEDDFGRAVALRTAQAMVLFLKRPGGQSQFSTQLSYEIAESAMMVELQTYIHEHINDDLRVGKLAEVVNMSARNFSRTFSREVGISPGKYVEQCRLELARRKLEESAAPLSRVAERCGYRSIDTMHAAFERQLGLSPSAYRSRFQSAANS